MTNVSNIHYLFTAGAIAKIEGVEDQFNHGLSEFREREPSMIDVPVMLRRLELDEVQQMVEACEHMLAMNSILESAAIAEQGGQVRIELTRANSRLTIIISTTIEGVVPGTKEGGFCINLWKYHDRYQIIWPLGKL